MDKTINTEKIILIKAGATFENVARRCGDFEEWIINGLGCGREHIRVIDIRTGVSLPDIHECEGVVISGSRSHVTENLDWVNALAAWVHLIVDAGIPVLGICFGHQLLAYAFGGKVDFNGKGREIGTVDINVNSSGKNDILFGSLPLRFPANVSHKQSVLTLPDGAVSLAYNGHDSNHAFRIGKCAWGLQFHPEFDQTVMRASILEQYDDLKKEGFDVEALSRSVRQTPEAFSILEKFAKVNL
ncbi:MAG TPA: glutamine amidotransferase [Desulfomonilia bacterium]